MGVFGLYMLVELRPTVEVAYRISFWLTALVKTVRLGWRAALGAHSSVECLEGCLGPQFFIELMGGFVLSEDSGSARFSQSC